RMRDTVEARRNLVLVAVEHALQRQEQDVVLVAEVLVDQPDADAARLRDLLDRRDVIAVLGEQLHRRVEDPGAPFLDQLRVADDVAYVVGRVPGPGFSCPRTAASPWPRMRYRRA